MTENEANRLLTVADVASLLSLSESAVYALAADGLLPHFRVGSKEGRIRVAREGLEEYLRLHCSRPRQSAAKLRKSPQLALRAFRHVKPPGVDDCEHAAVD